MSHTGAFAAATIGLNYTSRPGLLAETDWLGNLNIYSVYQPENDLPDQLEALQTIFAALGGDYWNAAYKQKSYAEQMQALVQASDTSVDSKPCGRLHKASIHLSITVSILCLACTGVTDVSFTQFASLFVLKVPWFTEGYSYCRWWGVTCCLTASESVLPTCTRGFQSVGQITLTGMLLTRSLAYAHSVSTIPRQSYRP